MSKQRNKKRKRGFRLHHDRRSVCVLSPTDDTVKTAFATSLAEMLLHTVCSNPPNLAALSVQAFGSTILPYSREQLALYAINAKSTHTLWIDSDMQFPKDMLLRFLLRDEPIIGINAMSRRPPFRCTAQRTPGEPLVTRAESTGLEKVYRMGFGVVWIETKILAEMPAPRFDFTYEPSLHCWRGEDFDFFERARAQGHEFYVDHDLSKEVFHVGSFGYNPVMMTQLLDQANAETVASTIQQEG